MQWLTLDNWTSEVAVPLVGALSWQQGCQVADKKKCSSKNTKCLVTWSLWFSKYRSPIIIEITPGGNKKRNENEFIVLFKIGTFLLKKVYNNVFNSDMNWFLCDKNIYLYLLHATGLSVPPENVRKLNNIFWYFRKLEVFWCVPGLQKKTSGME